jgi:hypothetical protein
VETGRFNSPLAAPRPADPGAGRKALFQARRGGSPFAQRNSLPAILEPSGYDRWLGLEPDPRDYLPVRANDDVAHLQAREQAGK